MKSDLKKRRKLTKRFFSSFFCPAKSTLFRNFPKVVFGCSMFGCTLVRDRLLAKRGLVAKVIGLKRIHIEVVARFTHTHTHCSWSWYPVCFLCWSIVQDKGNNIHITHTKNATNKGKWDEQKESKNKYIFFSSWAYLILWQIQFESELQEEKCHRIFLY